MKKATGLLLLPAMVVFVFAMKDPLPLGSGIPKADNKLKDISGKEVTLKNAMNENGLLVMFSCNTCPVVINNQARTREICQYAISKNIGVVLLNANEVNRKNSESLTTMQAYAKEQAYSWYYAEDKNNELADAFGASRTPACGWVEAMNEVLSGKEVSVKQSRSVGCSITRIF